MISAERLSKTTKLLEVIKKSELGNGIRSKETDSDALCKPETNVLQGKLTVEEKEKSKIKRNVEKEDIPRNRERESVSSKKTSSLKKSSGLDDRVEIDPSWNNRSKLEEELERKRVDKGLHDDSIYSADSSPNGATINKFPDVTINDALVDSTDVVTTNDRLETQRLQRIIKCNMDDNDFERSLPLTGDPEIDEEIIAFYKAKRSGGIY